MSRSGRFLRIQKQGPTPTSEKYARSVMTHEAVRNSKTSNQQTNAIVIGGSMAGLLAARVLADCYQTVVLIERDALDSSGENRRGVPQGRHTHGLLAGGREALET